MKQGTDVDSLSELLVSVRQDGWDAAYYRYCCRRVAAGELVDDERLADWRFFAPLHAESNVLVLGSAFGTVACCLAEVCKTVHVVDPDIRRLELLKHRCVARGIANVRGVHVNDPSSLPFRTESFHVIAFRIDDWSMPFRVFSRVVHELRPLLKDGGTVSLTVTNAWSPLRLVAGKRHKTHGASLRRYARLLRRADFAQPHVYAVLPSSDASPLFWVPIDDTGAFRYFIESLAGLFDLASPEARSRYARIPEILRRGLGVARRLGFLPLAAQFVPAFGLLAGLEHPEKRQC